MLVCQQLQHRLDVLHLGQGFRKAMMEQLVKDSPEYVQLTVVRVKENEYLYTVAGPLCCSTSRHATPESIAHANFYENRRKRWKARADTVKQFFNRLFSKAR